MIPSPHPKLVKLMQVNMAGIFVYLVAASAAWVEPQVRNVPGAGDGGAIVWGLLAFPTLAAFFLLDLGWVVLGGVAYFRKQQAWMLHPVFWLVPAMWALASRRRKP